MAFLETPRFPVDLNYGSTGGPTFSTDVIVFGNGREYRNQNWSQPRYLFDARYSIKTRADALNVYEFFLAVEGAYDGFRIKDHFDYSSNADGYSTPSAIDQSIGVGDDSTQVFQLIKSYTKGNNTFSRTILKPVAASYSIAVNGVTQTETTDYILDTTTGLVTFGTAPGNGLSVTAGFEFDVPVRFRGDDMSSILANLLTAATTDIVSIEQIPLIELRDV